MATIVNKREAVRLNAECLNNVFCAGWTTKPLSSKKREAIRSLEYDVLSVAGRYYKTYYFCKSHSDMLKLRNILNLKL